MSLKSTSLFLFIIILNSFLLQAQQRQVAEFGEPTDLEISMTSFPKDPEANAVVLFEQGKNHFKEKL